MPDYTDAHPVHGRNHAWEVLVRDDDSEEPLAEDTVSVLTNTLKAVPLVIPTPGHRSYNLFILTFRLPLWANIRVEAHVGVVSGDSPGKSCKDEFIIVVPTKDKTNGLK